MEGKRSELPAKSNFKVQVPLAETVTYARFITPPVRSHNSFFATWQIEGVSDATFNKVAKLVNPLIIVVSTNLKVERTW